MNDEDGIFSIRDSLPEEVKKNTVAMGKNTDFSYVYICNSPYCSNHWIEFQ